MSAVKRCACGYQVPDEDTWDSLPIVGEQTIEGEHMDLRDCPGCGSTIARVHCTRCAREIQPHKEHECESSDGDDVVTLLSWAVSEERLARQIGRACGLAEVRS